MIVKKIMKKIDELIERHEEMLNFEYHLGAAEALAELYDWIDEESKGGVE